MSGENSYIPVRVCSTADIPNETNNGYTMESTANAVLTIDGINVIVSDWILLRYQTDSTENGLYLMTQLGIAGVNGQHWKLERSGQGSKLTHNMVFQVIEGTVNASNQFRIAELDPITSGFTSLPPTTAIIPNVVDYVIGDLTTLCENEVEISNFKLEDSPLYNEKLFNFMVNIIKRNLQNNNK